jgi:AbrB family looped-hinge helix DNA binding protein
MAPSDTTRVGKRGTYVIPAYLRRRFGLEEGALVIAEAAPDGILLRPAVAFPAVRYTREQQAAYLLENAIGAPDYAAARKAVRGMGLDPDAVPHSSPDSTPRTRRPRKK